MKELLEDVDTWLSAGQTEIALATVIATWGSAPRKVGAKMGFTAGGASVTGSVSGGCVEGAVIEAGNKVLAGGEPRLLSYGVADETAWDVGLACGGSIEIFVERLDLPTYELARRWLRDEATGTIATVIRGPAERIGRKLAVDGEGRTTGEIGGGLDTAVIGLAATAPSSRRVSLSDEIDVFLDVLQPAPAVIIVGGAHIAVALAKLAAILNFRTRVIDPRRVFGSQERFPGVNQLEQVWPEKAFAGRSPDSRSAVVTLSHDPKIDDQALRVALDSEAFYIGALGSRKTHARRRERLAAMGYGKADLDRIHAPVGLDIGADNPEEIALAVMAEIVAAYRGRDIL